MPRIAVGSYPTRESIQSGEAISLTNVFQHNAESHCLLCNIGGGYGTWSRRGLINLGCSKSFSSNLILEEGR